MNTVPLSLTEKVLMLEAARAISSGASWRASELLIDGLSPVPTLRNHPELLELKRALREPRRAAPPPAVRP